MEYGADQRELLDTRAGEVYREVIETGSLPDDDPRLADEHPDQPAFALLIDLGLLALNPANRAYDPVDPVVVQSRVVVPMGQRGAELLNESTEWANTFGSLGQVYRRTPERGTAITEVRGFANINRLLTAAIGDAERELLTAQPSGGRSAATLDVAFERDVRALQRGVVMRTLYQHSARRSVATREYVERVKTHGAEVRTLDEFFNRLIVIDRNLAIVPGVEGTHVALAIHDQGLIAYLADIFERYWERARDFTDRELSTERDIADDVHNMTVRMLVEGHSDNASAKRVGVSTRTYAAYVAALKEEYGAQTRFQLGYAMGQQEAKAGRRKK
jgi:sugar-specific transcriptional regulator TrmB